jgi:hypothetical protein
VSRPTIRHFARQMPAVASTEWRKLRFAGQSTLAFRAKIQAPEGGSLPETLRRGWGGVGCFSWLDAGRAVSLSCGQFAHAQFRHVQVALIDFK